jgi:hypothetical protein
MMLNIQTQQKTPLLDQRNTQLFIKDMEAICEKVDFISFIEIVQKYPFYNLDKEEFNSFIEQAKEEHGYWHNNPLDIKINLVEEFDSKCIACSFGKTVKGFRVEYLKLNDLRLPGRIVYEKNFALNFELKDNELIDFGWCNAFLEKEEMKEIQS